MKVVFNVYVDDELRASLNNLASAVEYRNELREKGLNAELEVYII